MIAILTGRTKKICADPQNPRHPCSKNRTRIERIVMIFADLVSLAFEPSRLRGKKITTTHYPIHTHTMI